MRGVVRRGFGHRAARWICQLADRGPTWGIVEVRPERFGVIHYRLAVYPPGTDAATRRWLRTWHAWRGTVLLLCAGTAFLLTLMLPLPLAIAVPGIPYLAGWLLIRSRTGAARRGIRHLYATDYADMSSKPDRARCARLLRMATTLSDADRSLRAGELTPVQHELVWARVYDEVGVLNPPHHGIHLRVRSATPSR